jgi:hypothetical protein
MENALLLCLNLKLRTFPCAVFKQRMLMVDVIATPFYKTCADFLSISVNLFNGL